MRFYEIRDAHGSLVYAATLDAAHRRAKNSVEGCVPLFDARTVVVAEVEVPTDKGGVLRLLNDDPRNLAFAVLRRWELSPRGGLIVYTED